MHIDPALTFGSFCVAIVVGLTGMGGGALMTPMLMLIFHVPPLAAVSSDLVSSAIMKPFGGLVHLRHGTVHLGLVRWLAAGSVPGAFCGVLLTRLIGYGPGVQQAVTYAMGVALLLAAAGLTVRGYLALVERARHGTDRYGEPASSPPPDVAVRRIPTLLIGSVGGLLVGMTSVGSGSLIIVGLIAIYPGLTANRLVGTDLVQAVPLVIAAAAGHLIFGEFRPSVTAALLIGSIPGVYLGARLSSRAPGGLIRRLLGFVLLVSALKMFGIGNLATLCVVAATIVGGTAVWVTLRRGHGLPAVRDRAPDSTSSGTEPHNAR